MDSTNNNVSGYNYQMTLLESGTYTRRDGTEAKNIHVIVGPVRVVFKPTQEKTTGKTNMVAWIGQTNSFAIKSINKQCGTHFPEDQPVLIQYKAKLRTTEQYEQAGDRIIKEQQTVLNAIQEKGLNCEEAYYRYLLVGTLSVSNYNNQERVTVYISGFTRVKNLAMTQEKLDNQVKNLQASMNNVQQNGQNGVYAPGNGGYAPNNGYQPQNGYQNNGYGVPPQNGSQNQGNGYGAAPQNGYQNQGNGYGAPSQGGYQNSGYGAPSQGGNQNQGNGYGAPPQGGYQNQGNGYGAPSQGSYQNQNSGYGAPSQGGNQNKGNGYGTQQTFQQYGNSDFCEMDVNDSDLPF